LQRMLWKKYEFIAGVDLSWSFRKDSWVALAKRKGFLYEFCDLFALKDFLDFEHFFAAHPSLLLAIDAPLRIPNSDGNRKPERELAPLLRKAGWGILPISRSFILGRFPLLFEFHKLLEKHDFQVVPIPEPSKARVAIEVFASLSAIALCADLKIVRQRGEVFIEELLPCLKEETGSFFAKNLETYMRPLLLERQKGRDVVDALLCLYTAWVATVCPERIRIFGNPEEGFIVVPLSKFSPAWLIP